MPVRVFQNNFSGGEISPAMWSRVDLAKYATGCELAENGIVHPHGGISKRGGTRLVAELPGEGYLIPFTYRVEQAYILCFTDGHLYIYANGNLVTDLASPYLLPEVKEMSTVQSADTMFIAHPSHPPRRLERYLDGNLVKWRFVVMQFEPGITAPAAPTLAWDGANEQTKLLRYQVSAVSAAEEESYPSPAASISIPKSWTAGAKVTITWAAVNGAVRYNIYKNERGFYGWIGTVESTETLSFLDDNISPASGDGPKQEGVKFNAANTYPGVVGIYQQRLVFARSNSEPQTIWCSQSGALNNFSTSYPLKDTDAIEVAMDSRQMNEIRHLYLLKNQLVVLTAGAEWFMGPGRNSDGITPTNVHFVNQSFYGCAKVPPLQAGEALISVLNSGRAVRDLYGTYTDEYEGNEISIMAEHLFSSPIVDWAWQEEPFHTAYAVREDGVMLCLTYMREQQLSAWSHLVTDGKYLSVSCIRESASDRVYVVTRREVGGVTRYFVEQIVQRRYGDAIEDAFFVDCGVTRTGASIVEDAEHGVYYVTGIDHLIGRNVVALADGGEVLGLTVERYVKSGVEGVDAVYGGRITLKHPATKVHVGLPYAFTLRTLDPKLDGPAGSTAGLRKNVVSAVMRVRETRGVQLGPDEEHLILAKFPLQINWSGDNSAPPLFTGEVPLVLPGLHRREATLYIRQESPLPVTLLSLNITVNSEG